MARISTLCGVDDEGAAEVEFEDAGWCGPGVATASERPEVFSEVMDPHQKTPYRTADRSEERSSRRRGFSELDRTALDQFARTRAEIPAKELIVESLSSQKR